MNDDLDDDASAEADDLAPHPKASMTSSLGRFVERVSYIDLVLATALVLAASSAWFIAAPVSNGLGKSVGLFEAAYFVLVTFTSLGYGDLTPLGWGRAVAVFDVLFGLAVVATLIGKAASERQASLLMLLHTSDTQRRITDFAKELAAVRARVTLASDERDIDCQAQQLDSQVKLTRAIKNYLVFNSHQTIMIQFGNFTALIGLYDEIRDSFEAFDRQLHAARDLDEAVLMPRLLASMDGLHRLVLRMTRIHATVRRRAPIWRTMLGWARLIAQAPPSTADQAARSRAVRLERNIATRLAAAESFIATGHHPMQLRRVLAAWPAGPRGTWPTGVHKAIAHTLGLSNSEVVRCVDDLLAAGKLPKAAKTTAAG